MTNICERCGKPMGDSYFWINRKTKKTIEICHGCRAELKFGGKK